MSERVNLLPLNTVLFPRGLVPLRIFEPHYLDTISRCLREDSPFGICLRKNNKSEVLMDRIHHVGTTCQLIDWGGLDNGLLGFLIRGKDRFTVYDIQVEEHNLWAAQVTMLESTPDHGPSLSSEFQDMAELLQKMLEHLKPLYKGKWLIDDSDWVFSQLAALLPLDTDKKQSLLEIDDVMVRLHHLRDEIRKIGLL